MRVALLVRVSTNRQDYDRQISELTLHCQSMNWDIIGIFANKVSGAKKNEEREEIVELLKFIEHNDIDKVCVLEISRLGRNTLEALKVIENIKKGAREANSNTKAQIEKSKQLSKTTYSADTLTKEFNEFLKLKGLSDKCIG